MHKFHSMWKPEVIEIASMRPVKHRFFAMTGHEASKALLIEQTILCRKLARKWLENCNKGGLC